MARCGGQGVEGQVERRVVRADVKVKIGRQGRMARAGGKDGPFLGISPQNGEKCISLLLHYRPIPGNSILRSKFKIISPKQENSISLISILSTKHPLKAYTCCFVSYEPTIWIHLLHLGNFLYIILHIILQSECLLLKLCIPPPMFSLMW